jgi:SAP domain
MPRAKRALAEADANASQPALKKVSKNTSAATGNENQMESLASKTNAELISMLKDRGLPRTGNKTQLVARLQDSAGASSSSEGNVKASSNKSSNEMEYMTMCRPFDDIEAEKRANDEDYDSEDAELNLCGSKSCMCKKPLNKHPEWKWIISKKGFEAVKHFQKETMNRDQDVFGQYHYNDFSGYDFQEAVNNELQTFHKEYSKKKPDPYALWCSITGFAYVIPGSGAWFMCDDSMQIAATMELLGYAILATMDVLKKNDLLKADSKVKDLSLVLAMYLEMVAHWEEMEDELGWRVPMIEKAEANGIKLSGPYGIEDRVTTLKEEYDGEDADWADFEWKEKVECPSVVQLLL